MDKTTKLQALFAVAKAYKDRGSWLQYDQLSLDRIAVISSRRQELAPPEAATAQRFLFLDCSSFVWACYYHTFNYMLEADLTWHMIDNLTPRVYYYELTHNETPEELDDKKNEVRNLLQPGDIITYQNENGAGHSMLYIDEHIYVNCSGYGAYNGYHYKETRNIFNDCGGIYYESAEDLLTDSDDPVAGRNYLFKANKKRFAIHRPLDIAGDPTEDAMLRIGAASGLVCSVETNYPGGKTAEYGSLLLYKLIINNKNDKDTSVRLCFKPGRGSTASAQETPEFVIKAGSEKTVEFTAQVSSHDPIIKAPEITVNGLPIAAPLILVGHNLELREAEQLCRDVEKEYSENSDLGAAVSNAYKKLGICVFPDAKQSLRRLFFLHDGYVGDVLSRRLQEPEKDMCVMTYFGGTGVVTPEICSALGIRCTYISKNDLQAGDIILVGNDANHTNANEYFWNGERMLGTNIPSDEFIDSLFGKYCFAVLRPSLSKGRN